MIWKSFTSLIYLYIYNIVLSPLMFNRNRLPPSLKSDIRLGNWENPNKNTNRNSSYLVMHWFKIFKSSFHLLPLKSVPRSGCESKQILMIAKKYVSSSVLLYVPLRRILTFRESTPITLEYQTLIFSSKIFQKCNHEKWRLI